MVRIITLNKQKIMAVLSKSVLDKLKHEKENWDKVVENMTFDQAVKKGCEKYDDHIDVVLYVSRMFSDFHTLQELRNQKEIIKSRIFEITQNFRINNLADLTENL